jgi:hypothetical protein
MVAAGGAIGAAFSAGRPAAGQHGQSTDGLLPTGIHPSHGLMITVGDVDNRTNGFDPAAMLTDWETGTVSQLPNGRRLRTFQVVAEDKEIEIAPGVLFPAWTYNGRVPGHLSSAWLDIPYPWVLGEKHEIKLVTKTGTTFKKEIDVAVPTPQAQRGYLAPQALLGACVGIVPVVIGMLFYPAMRGMGMGGLNFMLALTVGLLAFLFADSLKEAFELAVNATPAFQGVVMVRMVAALAFLLLFVVGRRHGTPTGLALATYIALGIGLHNLGEGLAIGAAFAAGVAGLGAFLVLGFTLHNVTEGIGIVAPLTGTRPSLLTFAALALLAGGPAIPGIWLGSLSYSPHWSALALAVGAGAILQVIVEVSAYLMRLASKRGASLISPSALGGLMVGVAVMYATAMLVKI